MSDAWSVLNLSPSATEAAIRQRYLELVREFSPERNPNRFAEIRKAYDELRNPIERVRRRLFTAAGAESTEDVLSEIRKQAAEVRIPVSTLLNLAGRT